MSPRLLDFLRPDTQRRGGRKRGASILTAMSEKENLSVSAGSVVDTARIFLVTPSGRGYNRIAEEL